MKPRRRSRNVATLRSVSPSILTEGIPVIAHGKTYPSVNAMLRDLHPTDADRVIDQKEELLVTQNLALSKASQRLIVTHPSPEAGVVKRARTALRKHGVEITQ